MKDFLISILMLASIVVGFIAVMGFIVGSQPEKPCEYYANARIVNVPARCVEYFGATPQSKDDTDGRG